MKTRCASAASLVVLFLLICFTAAAQSSAAQVPEPQFARTTVSMLGGGTFFLGIPDTWAPDNMQNGPPMRRPRAITSAGIVARS